MRFSVNSALQCNSLEEKKIVINHGYPLSTIKPLLIWSFGYIEGVDKMPHHGYKIKFKQSYDILLLYCYFIVGHGHKHTYNDTL